MQELRLEAYYTKNLIEAGCDEVGVGSLAGPIVASSVILPKNYYNIKVRDSKTLTKLQRKQLCCEIKKTAISWSIGICSNEEVDTLNCKRASYIAMHRSIDKLNNVQPELLLIDGNTYKPHKLIPYICIVKGDSKFLSIAAASIVAKVFRDEYMEKLHQNFPSYNWKSNSGYATKDHIQAIKENGLTSFHRMTYGICRDKA